VTTESGRTHPCNCHDNGQTPLCRLLATLDPLVPKPPYSVEPGTDPEPTCTTALANASEKAGFTWDANWSNEFKDFFITHIANDSGTPTKAWLLYVNDVPAQVGGCQQKVKDGDRVCYGCTIYLNILYHMRCSDRAQPYGPTDRLVPLTVHSIAWPNDDLGSAYRFFQQPLPNTPAPHAQH